MKLATKGDGFGLFVFVFLLFFRDQQILKWSIRKDNGKKDLLRIEGDEKDPAHKASE